MAYLLDTNVFIAAKNLHYGMDFCPAFWDWLVQQNDKQRVFSIERVADELEAGNDPLAEWAAVRGELFFLRLDATVVPALARVGAWVTERDFDQAAVNTFLQVADYYLISQALAGGHTVVTHEILSGSKRRIKIPDVCVGLGIKHMSPFAMLRKERARFVLGAHDGAVGSIG